MRWFNGTLALIGGFIGVVLLGFAYTNRSLDPITGIICGLLIANGLWAVYRKVKGYSTKPESKRRGPLSTRKKRKT